MIVGRITDWARIQPARTAVIHNDRPVTYAAFARAIDAARSFLAGQGLQAGRTAVVALEDLAEAWFAVVGLRLLGLDTIAVQSIAQAISLDIRNVDCVVTTPRVPVGEPAALPGAKLIVMPAGLSAGMDTGDIPELPVGLPRPGDHILYTSGTTGTYKKLVMSSAGEDARAVINAEAQSFDARSVYHATNFGLWTSAGYRVPQAAWRAGGCVVIDQRPDFMRNLFRHAPTHTTLLPPDLKEFVRLGFAADRNRPPIEIMTGGAFLPLQLAEAIIRNPATKLVVSYGSTECSSLLLSTVRTGDDLIWLTPNRHRTVQIVDDDGNECPPGTEGSLRVLMAPCDSQAYLDDAETSARMFRGGFFYPGDRAVKRADGRIRILGRADEVLNFQGQKIAAGPIEQLLRDRLAVDEVCLFCGLTDDGKESLVIAVQSDRPFPQAELDAVAAQFPSFERVRVAVLKAFPRTATGMRKTRREELRRLLFEEDHSLEAPRGEPLVWRTPRGASVR